MRGFFKKIFFSSFGCVKAKDQKILVFVVGWAFL